MEIWPVLGITAAIYLISTWLMVWFGALLFDRTPAYWHLLSRRKKAPLPVFFLLENTEEQLEYAIRHTVWTSAVEGVPMRIYLSPLPEQLHPMLTLVRRHWPELQVEQAELERAAIPPEVWVLDLRHT